MTVALRDFGFLRDGRQPPMTAQWWQASTKSFSVPGNITLVMHPMHI